MKTKPQPPSKKKMRRHWYLRETHACPICGHEKVYLERQYGRPPAKAKRYVYREYWDYCGGL
jgi:hypothetical protein